MSEQEGKKRSSSLFGLIVIIGFVLLIIALIPKGSSGPAMVEYPSDPVIKYEITGTVRQVSVTYENDQGGTEQGDYVPPFSKTFYDFDEGDFVYISAQITGGTGDVTCKIYVDGQVAFSGTSHGSYEITTCSGLVGE